MPGRSPRNLSWRHLSLGAISRNLSQRNLSAISLGASRAISVSAISARSLSVHLAQSLSAQSQHNLAAAAHVPLVGATACQMAVSIELATRRPSALELLGRGPPLPPRLRARPCCGCLCQRCLRRQRCLCRLCPCLPTSPPAFSTSYDGRGSVNQISPPL